MDSISSQRSDSSRTLASSISDHTDSSGLSCLARESLESGLKKAQLDLIKVHHQFNTSKINSVNAFYHFSMISRHLLRANDRLMIVEPLVFKSRLQCYLDCFNALNQSLEMGLQQLNYKNFKILSNKHYERAHRMNPKQALYDLALSKAYAQKAGTLAEKLHSSNIRHTQWKKFISRAEKCALQNEYCSASLEKFNAMVQQSRTHCAYQIHSIVGLISTVREQDYLHCMRYGY